MAMIASLVYLDSSETFCPFKVKAVKYVLAGFIKRQKDLDLEPVQTPLYGPGPNQTVASGLRKVRCWDTFSKVTIMLADALNKLVTKPEDKKRAMEIVISLRALESVYNRTQDSDDIINTNDDVYIQTLAVHTRLTKTPELTSTSEGGVVVYQNSKLTMMELDYPSYKLTDNKDKEYKITWNDEVEIGTGRETSDMAGRCMYHFNAYVVISHGLGHWRVVPRESFNFHLQRMRDVFDKRRQNFLHMCPFLTDFKWSAVITAMAQNPRLHEREISTIIKSAVRPKRDTKTAKHMDIQSTIGIN